MNARWMWGLLAGAGCAAGAASAPVTRMVVLENNSNLRARALATAEVVGKLSQGDPIEAKGIEQNWVEIVPPTNVDLWVLGDYVREGVVECSQTVNVRAGPGINFSIVGKVGPGARVDVRGAHGEWMKIAPPDGSSVWIARELVGVAPPKPAVKPAPARQEPAAPPVPPPAPAVATRPPAPVAVPVPAAAPAAAPVPEAAPGTRATVFVPPAPGSTSAPPEQSAVRLEFQVPAGLDLVEAVGQGRWREVKGVLRPKDFIFRAPSEFRLVAEGGNRHSETICFVLGNRAQLQALLYRSLAMGGREYWVKRQKYPVLIPERIVLQRAPDLNRGPEPVGAERPSP